MNEPTESLTDRIRAAESAEEVEALMEEGRHFEYADDKRRRRWQRIAKHRLQQLALRDERN